MVAKRVKEEKTVIEEIGKQDVLKNPESSAR
jgi:hypothetical protein